MKTKLTGLLLTVAATALLAQAPPPPPTAAPGKSKAISVPVRTFTPAAPATISTVGTNATRIQNAPGTKAPELLPALPGPAGTLLAPATANPNRPPAPAVIALPGAVPAAGTATGTNVLGLLASRAATNLALNPIGEKTLDPALTRFQAMPLEQVMDLYSEVAGRTVLRSPTVNFDVIKLTLNTKTPLTEREWLQAIDSLLALNSIAVIPTGEKFLTVVPMQSALQEGAAFNTNATSDLPEASQYITKIVQVKNAKPTEVVPAIQPFAKLPGGILPIDATGVIVLRDNAINIKRMMEVLEKIDVVVPSDEEFKVIPVNYALAADVAQVLGSFTAAGPVAGGSTASRTGSSTTRRTGTTSPFGNNPGLNAVTGQTGATPFGTQQGLNTGIPGAAQPGTQQSQFQNRLNQIVSNITGGRGGGAPLLGEAKIIPYDRSNALLVLANKAELAMLTRLLKEIDVPQQQVLIEALIFETDLTHSDETSFGIGQQTAKRGANFFGNGGINTTFGFATNTATAFGGVGAATGGFAYAAQIGANWAAAVQLLESDSKTEVLSRPRIQTSHAEAATIFSGGTTPYVTGTTFNGVGSQQNIQQLQIGISMQVLPLITSDGLVVLDINQTIEGESGTVKIGTDDVPRTVRHTAQAKVAVKDGETIILGGLIRTARSKSVSGVPMLKDIPGLGVLFRTTTDKPTRKELMVLIRPTVLPTPQSASLAAQAERQRSASMRGVEQAVRIEELKQNRKIEEEEIEAMRKLMKKYPKGPIPLPDSSVPLPAAPATEKKGSNDFLDLPKTSTP